MDLGWYGPGATQHGSEPVMFECEHENRHGGPIVASHVSGSCRPANGPASGWCAAFRLVSTTRQLNVPRELIGVASLTCSPARSCRGSSAGPVGISSLLFWERRN